MALASQHEDDLLGDSSDLDFDSVTESGRAIANLVALMENSNDDMDLSVTSSGRTVDPDQDSSHHHYDALPENKSTVPDRIQSQSRSPAKAIPKQPSLPVGSSLSHPDNSGGSTGSSFLSGLFNPAQLSHTPPTLCSTSYESSHFGKRLRSGVSKTDCSNCFC
jgi:hypothetical protein